jgi:hypothetical protein
MKGQGGGQRDWVQGNTSFSQQGNLPTEQGNLPTEQGNLPKFDYFLQFCAEVLLLSPSIADSWQENLPGRQKLTAPPSEAYFLFSQADKSSQ